MSFPAALTPAFLCGSQNKFKAKKQAIEIMVKKLREILQIHINNKFHSKIFIEHKLCG